MSNTPNCSTHSAYPWQTKTFAARNHIEEQTARKRYSQTGSYFGIVPQKLANGRLTWPNVIVTKHGPIAANQDTMRGLGNTQLQRPPQPTAIRARSCFEEEQGE